MTLQLQRFCCLLPHGTRKNNWIFHTLQLVDLFIDLRLCVSFEACCAPRILKKNSPEVLLYQNVMQPCAVELR